MKSKFCFLIGCLGFFWSLQATVAFADKGPYYVKNLTWALSPFAYNGSHRPIAFLPRSYLFYTNDRTSTTKIGEDEYLRGLTQDGVDVFVIESDVSADTFKNLIGEHQIIFNSQYSLCKLTACDKAQAGTTWNVDRGDAFEIIEAGTSGEQALAGNVVKLKGTKPDEFVGYIGNDELTSLIGKGRVTRTDTALPRYKVKKIMLEGLDTRCGTKRKISDSFKFEGDIDNANRLLKAYPIIKIDDNDGNLLAKNLETHGGEARQMIFRLYEVLDSSKQPGEDGSKFFIAAVFEIKCRKGNLGRDTQEYIDKVSLFIERDEKSIGLKIGPGESSTYETTFETPLNLLSKTGAPYLISINHNQHYESVIEKLSGSFGDRHLAGYFMAELNRSCHSPYRKSDECKNHTY